MVYRPWDRRTCVPAPASVGFPYAGESDGGGALVHAAEGCGAGTRSGGRDTRWGDPVRFRSRGRQRHRRWSTRSLGAIR